MTEPTVDLITVKFPCSPMEDIYNLFVEDLGSPNGTAVNGQRIAEPVALKSGDVVNIGDVTMRVRYE